MKQTFVDGLPRNEYVKRPDQAAKRKLYRESHREEHAEYYRKYRQLHPERTLLRAAQNRSQKSGLVCTISEEDIVIPEVCPVLGIPIIIQAGRGTPGGKPNSPSLDRIDNSKGYILGNVQVISHKANSMKFTATPEELIKFSNWIQKTYG